MDIVSNFTAILDANGQVKYFSIILVLFPWTKDFIGKLAT